MNQEFDFANMDDGDIRTLAAAFSSATRIDDLIPNFEIDQSQSKDHRLDLEHFLSQLSRYSPENQMQYEQIIKDFFKVRGITALRLANNEGFDGCYSYAIHWLNNAYNLGLPEVGWIDRTFTDLINTDKRFSPLSSFNELKTNQLVAYFSPDKKYYLHAGITKKEKSTGQIKVLSQWGQRASIFLHPISNIDRQYGSLYSLFKINP